jgi:hypothetical protein
VSAGGEVVASGRKSNRLRCFFNFVVWGLPSMALLGDGRSFLWIKSCDSAKRIFHVIARTVVHREAGQVRQSLA